MSDQHPIKTENIEEAKQVIEVPAELQTWINQQNQYLLVPADQLKNLLAQLETAQQEREILYKVAYSLIDLFGFTDKETGRMIPEIASGEESFIPGMLKSLADVTGLLMKAKGGFTKNQRESANEELAKKFAFTKDLIPLIVKYGNQPTEQ